MGLNSCCFCCSLNQGTKGIAVYNLIRALMIFVFYCIMAVKLAEANVSFKALFFLMGGSLLMITFSILVIVGVQKVKSSYLVPFLILDALFICAIIASILSVYLYGPRMVYYVSPLQDSDYPRLTLIGRTLLIALEIYFLCVVLSCHRQLSFQQFQAKQQSFDLKPPPMYVSQEPMEDKPPPYPGV